MTIRFRPEMADRVVEGVEPGNFPRKEVGTGEVMGVEEEEAEDRVLREERPAPTAARAEFLGAAAEGEEPETIREPSSASTVRSAARVGLLAAEVAVAAGAEREPP